MEGAFPNVQSSTRESVEREVNPRYWLLPEHNRETRVLREGVSSPHSRRAKTILDKEDANCYSRRQAHQHSEISVSVAHPEQPQRFQTTATDPGEAPDERAVRVWPEAQLLSVVQPFHADPRRQEYRWESQARCAADHQEEALHATCRAF